MLHINALELGREGETKKSQCNAHVTSTLLYDCVYGCMATAKLCVHRNFLLFLVYGVREEKKWVHLKKLFNYFVWLESSLDSIVHTRTHKHRHTHTHSLACVYTGVQTTKPASKQAIEYIYYTPYTLISKLGKQIIIFVLCTRVYCCQNTNTFKQQNIYIKRHKKKKRNHSNVVSYLGARTQWRHWHTQYSVGRFFLSFFPSCAFHKAIFHV